MSKMNLIEKLKEIMYFSQGASTASEPIIEAKGTSNALYNIFTSLKDIVNILEKDPLAEEEDNLEANIEELGFTHRTRMCLYTENIITIRQLISFKEADLLKTPNLGKKSLSEIKDVLSRHGLSLKR